MLLYQSSEDALVYIEGSRVLLRRGTGRAVELVRLDPGFSAVDVALNKSGTLLAVAASNTLHIWIPESGSPAQRLRVDGLRFDDAILEVRWHPCAREDACLVVLTEHSLVSIYCPPGENAVIETTRLMDAENIELDAASMGFGSVDAPAGVLTLYVATIDGDIYKLAPFVPPEIELPQDLLTIACDFVPLGSWPVELSSWSEKYGEVTVLKRQSHEDMSMRLRGEPLKLMPYPDELYDEEVLDLAVGGLGSSWVADLIVQTTTNFVNLFVPESPASDSLVLVSCIKFSRPQDVRKVRVVTPKLIIINTQTETHVLHIENRLSELAQRRVKADSTEPVDLPAPRVESIALSYAYCTPQAVEAISIDDGSRHTWKLQSSDDALTDSLQKLHIDSDLPSFVRQPEPRWNTLAKMDVAPARKPTSMLDSNLAALYDLDSVSQSYEEKLASLLKALVEMQYDRQTQRQELLAQLEQATKFLQRMDTVDSKAQRLPGILEAVADRQAKLNERLRKLSGTIDGLEDKNTAERPLCAAELAWFDELETQLERKVTAAESQLSDLKRSVPSLEALRDSRTSSVSTRKLSHAQLHAIKRRLQDQANLIASLKTSLDQ